MARSIDNNGNDAMGMEQEKAAVQSGETRKMRIPSVEKQPPKDEKADDRKIIIGHIGQEPAVNSGGEAVLENPQLQEAETPKKKRGPVVVLVIILIALACVGGWFAYDYFSAAQAAQAAEENRIIATFADDGKIFDGVSAFGMQLGGMTESDANAWLLHEAQNKIDELAIEMKVDDVTLKLTGEEMGAQIDTQPVLEEALSYGREGNFFDRQKAIVEAESNGVELQYDIIYDENKIKASVLAKTEPLNVEPQDATVEIAKTSDEDSLKTGYDVQKKEGVTGEEVNALKLAEDVYAAVSENNFEQVQAEVIKVEPKVSTQKLDAMYTMKGQAETFYENKPNRVYNIWKMADYINGVKIEPGESWSINDEAGPRTIANGWRNAPGIREGKMVDEPGGGICQVSSTLYNAVIKAEVKILDRSHHSWPLSYVDGGLDATISTGSPDFVIENNYDIPIYIIAECDASRGSIQVGIYGPPYEDGLTRHFESVALGVYANAGENVISDGSLPQGQRVVERSGKPGKKFRIDKIYKDADGNIIKREDGWSVETYSPISAIVRVGTAAPKPTPVPQPDPTPDPTPDPEPEPPVDTGGGETPTE